MFTWILLAIVVLYVIYHLGSYWCTAANYALQKGQTEKALRRFDFACRYLHVDPYNRSVYGAMLLKNGRPDEARKELNLALMHPRLKNKDKYYAKSILALLAYKEGDLDGAIASMEDVLKNCRNSFHYGNLGYLYIARGDLDKALEFNREAAEFNEDDALILDNLADTYLKRGETEEAAAVFEKLMAKEPRFPDAYFHYGQYLAQKGDIDGARAQFNRALEGNFSYISPISREQVEQEIEALHAQ